VKCARRLGVSSARRVNKIVIRAIYAKWAQDAQGQGSVIASGLCIALVVVSQNFLA
jgi:hypothetical protein